MDTERGDGGGMGALNKLSSKLSQFLSELKSVKSGQYLLSLAQLCYADTKLAYEMWSKLFPRLWAALSDQQRQVHVYMYVVHVHVFKVYILLYIHVYTCTCINQANQK